MIPLPLLRVLLHYSPFLLLECNKKLPLPSVVYSTLRDDMISYLILFFKCDCWIELRKAELIERSYLLSLRLSLFKEDFKIQYVFNEACLYEVVREVEGSGHDLPSSRLLWLYLTSGLRHSKCLKHL